MVKLPKVLINSVPKSGTHLFIQILLGLQGVKIAPTWIYEQNFQELKSFDSGTVAPAHLPYSKRFVDQLKEWDIKTIFISRDLRDIAVSLYHFAMEDRFGGHPLHPILKEFKTEEERLMAVIKGASTKDGRTWPNILEFTKTRYEWLNTPGVLCVTYDEFMRDFQSRDHALDKIVNYLWDDLQSLQMTKRELKESLKNNIKPKESGTFRKGTIGSWKQEFTEKHKSVFKDIAGDFLIHLGYEKDYNW